MSTYAALYPTCYLLELADTSLVCVEQCPVNYDTNYLLRTCVPTIPDIGGPGGNPGYGPFPPYIPNPTDPTTPSNNTTDPGTGGNNGGGGTFIPPVISKNYPNSSWHSTR